MTNQKPLYTLLLLFVGLLAQAQTIIWTGAASDNNFFTEGNWKNSVTNAIPSAGSINPGKNINVALQINTTATIIASGSIQFGKGSLILGSATVSATSLSGGNITINEDGYLNLSAASPFLNNVQINLTSGIGWIQTISYNPTAVSANSLGQIKVNNTASVYQTNLRLDNYYLNGCVIRANLSSTTPLTIYDDINTLGNSTSITVNTIHSGSAIAGFMDNKIKSFVLKKGFMVTLAIEEDGTGKSKNYIATETDLVINALPEALLNSISFIRVMPWNWVTKKGRTGEGTDLNTSWRYQWNNKESSSLDTEFAPMSWSGRGADDDADIALYVGKYNSTHLMSFNEPDDCNAQSGATGNPKLCTIDEAVRLHKNLMKTGMRLVSPAGREEAPFKWLKEFSDKANELDIRIDVIAVHWYDWASKPRTNTNPTALEVFERFKAYVTRVHNLYGLPIWITEFNANPNRSPEIQVGFMELALPYLETLPYVERYNWYQPNSLLSDPENKKTSPGTGEFYTTKPPGESILTKVGTTYKNQVSSPAVP